VRERSPNAVMQSVESVQILKIHISQGNATLYYTTQSLL